MGGFGAQLSKPGVLHPMRRRSRGLRALALLLIAALCALVVSACGGDDPDASPAEIVPAGAPLYFEVTVRPEGDLRADAEAAARTILDNEDPVGELRRLINRFLAEDRASLEEDVDPWLGRRVGFVAADFQGDAERFAVIAATEDADEAIDSIVATRERSESGELQDRSHNGVDYRLDEEGEALAEVGGFAVLGDEQTVRQIIDAEDSGRTLESDEQFTNAVDAVAEDRLGLAWIDFSAFVDVIARDPSFPPTQAGALRQLFAMQGLEVAALALTADQAAVRLDTAVLGGDRQARQAADPRAASQALRALPAGALLGVGLGDVGAQLEQQIAQLGQLGALGGQDPEQILRQIEQATGLNVQEDVLAWMEQGSLFVQGASLADIGGALVVRTSDPQASLDALEKVEPLLEQAGDAEIDEVDRGGVEGLRARFEGLPLPVFLVVAGDRFIAAVGEPALDAAVEPRGALGEDPAFSQAAGVLGEGIQPTFYASVPRILELARIPLGQEPAFQEVSRYLDAFTAVVAGTAREGEITRGRVALGLRQR